MRSLLPLLPALTALAALAGCRDPIDGDVDTDDAIAWPDPVTTLTERILADPPLPEVLPQNPAFPEGLAAAEAAGLGGWTRGPGEPRLLRDDGAPGHAADTGPDRRSLWMVFHQSDAQLADADSPARFVASDLPGETQSAARPQELYVAHALDALIRAANGLHEVAPIDFALATGDDADNNQEDEVRWFSAIWDGVPVKVDAGAPDAQPDADGHDPLAPFTPVGADFPWYTVAGNHDVLVQGNFPHDPWVDSVRGDDAPMGTRDLSQPGGPLTFTTVADASRRVLERSDLAALYLDSPATPGPVGHGFTEANVRDDTVGWTAEPVAGVPIRLISVDANPHGIGDGALSAAERDGWLVPQLEAAERDGRLVVLTSHYALGGVPVEGGGTVGDLLVQHPNVVAVLCGHSHVNAIRWFGTPDDADGFWEITTASTVDWPPQGRLVELVANGDGTLSIYTTIFDFPAPEGSLAARMRTLAAIDRQSGWRLWDGSGEADDRNTELVQRLPDGFDLRGGRPGVRSAALP
jgi:3',5'-cyclic AMP phosphodiesterase CpdA